MLGRGSGVASVIGTLISSSYSYVTVESGVSATTLDYYNSTPLV